MTNRPILRFNVPIRPPNRPILKSPLWSGDRDSGQQATYVKQDVHHFVFRHKLTLRTKTAQRIVNQQQGIVNTRRSIDQQCGIISTPPSDISHTPQCTPPCSIHRPPCVTVSRYPDIHECHGTLTIRPITHLNRVLLLSHGKTYTDK